MASNWSKLDLRVEHNTHNVTSYPISLTLLLENIEGRKNIQNSFCIKAICICHNSSSGLQWRKHKVHLALAASQGRPCTFNSVFFIDVLGFSEFCLRLPLQLEQEQAQFLPTGRFWANLKTLELKYYNSILSDGYETRCSCFLFFQFSGKLSNEGMLKKM